MAGVSAKDAGEPPICDCGCGLAKKWNKDPRKRAGGYWRCPTTYAAAKARYNQSEKGRARDARSKARERAGLVTSSTKRKRAMQSRREQAKIDALLELHPDLKELIYPNG